MKKVFLISALTAISSATTMADVKVNMMNDCGLKEVTVTHTTIDALLNTPRGQELKIDSETYPVKNCSFTFPLSAAGPSRYSIDFSETTKADFYAAPGENLVVDVKSLSPLDYTVSGTALMEGMTLIESQTAPIVAKFQELQQNPAATDAELQSLVDSYNKVLKDYVAANPDNPAAAFALLELDGEDFINGLGSLQQGAMMSILYPAVMQRKPMVEMQLQKEKIQREMAAGNIDAPDFTLKDLAGKDMSLKDLRGKWVIIDFWGSWCQWCIKGFPKLKEVYEANKDRLEVLGVACQDSDSAWRAAVEKYQLPWVNVYSPQKDNSVEQLYGIQGFPTKVIVNPQGKVVDITTGDDPGFYTKLEKLMK